MGGGCAGRAGHGRRRWVGAGWVVPVAAAVGRRCGRGQRSRPAATQTSADRFARRIVASPGADDSGAAGQADTMPPARRDRCDGPYSMPRLRVRGLGIMACGRARRTAGARRCAPGGSPRARPGRGLGLRAAFDGDGSVGAPRRTESECPSGTVRSTYTDCTPVAAADSRTAELSPRRTGLSCAALLRLS
jgi:hypothetical protein